LLHFVSPLQNVSEYFELLHSVNQIPFISLSHISHSNIVNHFQNVQIQELTNLSHSQLNDIFSSDLPQYIHEDTVLHTILQIIELNSNLSILLYLVHFPKVSSEAVIKYFKDKKVDDLNYDLNYDLWKSFKERLFCKVIPYFHRRKYQNLVIQQKICKSYEVDRNHGLITFSKIKRWNQSSDMFFFSSKLSS
jgi:hypothetical protein